MKSRQHERGFTLIEIIVASFILVLGVTMISTVFIKVVNKNFLSLRHTQAVNLAQNKIEELMNEGYVSTSLDEGSYSNPLNPVNETGDSNGVFDQYWEIEDVNPIERAKLVTSRVEWDDADGIRRSVYLTGVCIDESN
ncbi:prepilin-type N-terminal cleavage/methylation domain-containing protein [Candidatus Latescibacterota bacterium]